MAKATINTEGLKLIFEKAMVDSVEMLEDKIKSITPRDPARPPKNPDVPVTGNLKRSIGHKQLDQFKFIIWTKQDEAEYWRHLEFWTMHMESRSFLRLWIEMFKPEIIKNFKKQVRKGLK